MIPVGAVFAVIVILVILGIIAAARSFKVIQQYEKGVIYRFGQVLPELRGRGVGRLLMEAAYAQMRQAGATTVALEMVANNDVARRFYEREGFTTTFVQMHRRLAPD